MAVHAVMVLAGDLAPYGAPDGQLNAADVLILQRFVLGELIPTADELRIGDVAPLGSLDGALNTGDLVVLMRAVMGEITLPAVTLAPDAPVLNTDASTTNANPYPVTGTSAPGLTIDLYVNGQLDATTTAATDGSFSFSATLLDGSNSLYAVAMGNGISSTPSNILTVDYINNISRDQSGTLTQDTVWTPGTGGSYVISSDLYIDPGVTLTLQPGVEVRIASNMWIVVDGSIKVLGTAVAPVRFTSDSANPAQDDWLWIEVTANSTDTVFDHAIFEYSDTGIWFNGGTGTVTNCLFRYNSFGLDIQGPSSPLIQSNTFTNNTDGIRATGTTLPGGDPGPIVNGNSFESNTTHYRVFDFYDVETRLDARNNWWGGTVAGAIADAIHDVSDHTLTYPADHPVIEFTPFLDGPGGVPVAGNYLYGFIYQDMTVAANTATEVADGTIVAPGVTLTVEQGATLQFYNKARMVVRGDLQVQGIAGNVVNFIWPNDPTDTSTVEYVRIQPESSGSVIDHALFEYAYRGLYFWGGSGVVTNSEFRYNTYGIDIQAGSTAAVSSSTFTNNNYGIRIQGASNTSINAHNTLTDNNIGIWANGTGVAGGNPTPVVRGNNLHNNGWNYYTSNFDAPAAVVLDARRNWWGTMDDAVIQLGIFDAADDPSGSPQVLVDPALEGPVAASTILPPALTAAPALTNSSPFVITGEADAGLEVRLFVNGVQQDVTNAATDSSFSFVVALTEGANSLHVTAFDGSGESAPSKMLMVTLDTTTPVIGLTNPVDGGQTNTAIVTGQLSEPAILIINSTAVTLAPDNSFIHTLAGVSDGANQITLLATDPAGNSAQQTISFTLDTNPPTAPVLTGVNAGAINAGQTTVTGGPGSAEADALVSLTNSRTGETVVANVTADGSFNAVIAAQAGDSLVVLVSDAAGNSSVTRLLQIAGTAPTPVITPNALLDGSSVAAERIAVEGVFQGPANLGFSVNGVTTVTVGNRFCTGDVLLKAGVNTLTVTATTAAGIKTTQTLTVTSTGPAALQLDADPAEGFAPATVTFSLTDQTGATLQTLYYDFDGDGTTDSTTTDPALPVQYTYTTPGCYTARVTATDDVGGTYSATQLVAVQDVSGLEGQLAAVWYGTLSQLRAGNITSALNAMTDTMSAKYETIFVNLGPDLAAVVDQLGTVIGGGIMGDVAEFIVAREEEGAQIGFKVYLVRDHDGVWRISEM